MSPFSDIPADLSDTADSDPDASTPQQTPSTPSITSAKRKRNERLHELWSHCRANVVGIEPYRDAKREDGKGGKRIWYCKFADCHQYSTMNSEAAKKHLLNSHAVACNDDSTSKIKKARQLDLRRVVSDQKLKRQEDEDNLARSALRTAANRDEARQALLRLIVRRDLPLSMAKWPEMNTLIHTINYMANDIVWDSHTTTANHLRQTYATRREQVKLSLRRARSRVHLTTDTWHSPNHHELQAITAHWLDADNTLRKALLALPEMRHGHSGEQVAAQVLTTLRDFDLLERLGYVTTDNATSNDTMCRAIAASISTHNKPLHWSEKEHRLRCLGHIINLAVQGFFFAENKEAIEEAIRQAEQSRSSIDDKIVELSSVDNVGWLKQPALQKIHLFGSKLRHNDRLFNAFRDLAGKALRAPNDTRWFGWFDQIASAYTVKTAYSEFIHQHPNELAECELGIHDWQLIELTIDILQPFKDALLACEGDDLTLDQMQYYMDSLKAHLQSLQELYKHDASLQASLMTCWYAFDKFYALIDRSAAYVSAVLLHPSRRKSYLVAVWKQSWIAEGVARAKELWRSRYKQEQEYHEVLDDDVLQTLPYHQRWSLEIARKQRNKGVGALDEFERFIAAAPDDIGHLTVLEWWLQPQQQRVYPQLQQMAIDVLTAPAMSAESERVFSGARRTIPWSRARLGVGMIEILQCLKHWQISGIVDENFEITDEVVGDDEVEWDDTM